MIRWTSTTWNINRNITYSWYIMFLTIYSQIRKIANFDNMFLKVNKIKSVVIVLSPSEYDFWFNNFPYISYNEHWMFVMLLVLVEHELFTLLQHMSSLLIFNGGLIAQPLVFCEFFFGSLLAIFLLSVLGITDSYWPFLILKLSFRD